MKPPTLPTIARAAIMARAILYRSVRGREPHDAVSSMGAKQTSVFRLSGKAAGQQSLLFDPYSSSSLRSPANESWSKSSGGQPRRSSTRRSRKDENPWLHIRSSPGAAPAGKYFIEVVRLLVVTQNSIICERLVPPFCLILSCSK